MPGLFLWLTLTFDLFPQLIFEYFNVKFDDPSYVGFWYSADKQTDRRRWGPDSRDCRGPKN